MAYLREMIGRSGKALRLGPFLALFDPASDNRYRNYAVPDDGAIPGPDELATLTDAFLQRGRLPRLEYVPELSPELLPLLNAAGFTAEGLLPLMSCAPSDLRAVPAPEGFSLSMVEGSDDLLAAADVQNAAYGEGAAGEADIARLRATIEKGGAVALARSADGSAAGAALFGSPAAGSAEIAGLGVAEAFRRRGIGAALTALLTAEAHSRGLSHPFLMAAGEDEERLYARIGFKRRGTMLHISRLSP